MTAITAGETAAWMRRLSGGLSREDTEDHRDQHPPDWYTSAVIRLDGPIGMQQLSNFGTMKAADPLAFEAALLRRSIGATMLFSTLETPHTVTYDRGAPQDEDIIIVGMSNLGGQRLHTAHGVHDLRVGRMGFMSSVGSSAAEHLGLSETTGVVVPLTAIPGYRHTLSDGAGLFPDTPLTRAAGAAMGRMLYEWVRDADQDAGALTGTESALVALVRGLFRQLPGDGETDRVSRVRAEAAQIIERRHRDAGFGIDELAAELHMSRRQLFRFFAGADESLSAQLLRRRLATAREELLVVPAQELAVVASKAGFVDAAALRAQFSRHVGGSPSAFRLAARSRPVQLAEAMLLTDEQTSPPQ
ncbi:helix-turn-helix domain-containing protein [Microbacterium sp. SSW1-49]|uniref:Helix-turn-helix domain-containing protein n=1 Tax=Microbacterium croceum TaxID=2851645 RepID=A0ABT0FI08_9MICO|nr:AraC family transcriptional regulator [Microbacterium croceum]MCK2037692.1 helix-turn-helix domain-containing protein [Microbacterium croceum]